MGTNKKNDRLSSLPIYALKIILSFLPTKSTVATSVLSSSWRYHWTNVAALRFTVNYIPTPKVYAILFHTIRRLSWPKIKAIELNIEPPKKSKPPYTHPTQPFIDLVHNIVYNGPSVKELKVNFIASCEISYLITLPFCVFEKKSIEVLEVHGFKLDSQGNQGINFKLPNLRKLVINVCNSDLQFFGNLVKSCPLLEVLRVHIDRCKNENSIEIIAHNLKWLSINVVSWSKVTVDAPKLKYLEVDSPVMLKFCFIRAPIELVKANVFMRDDWDNGAYNPKQQLLGLVNVICRVSTLKLTGDIAREFCVLKSNVAKFNKLTHLEMGWSCSLGWKGVKRFLQRCPNLECLVLRREAQPWCYRSFYQRNKEACDAFVDKLEKHDITPCLMSKLERIEMWNFDGNDEYQLIIEYIIRVAKDLKTHHIFIDASRENQQFNNLAMKLGQLSVEFPACDIKIIGMSDVPRS